MALDDHLMSIKNRGSFSNPEGRFEKKTHQAFDDGWEKEEEVLPPLDTLFFPEKAKTIITHNDSPDIGFDQSINSYRGCEHGCIYCYARPSHAYMNLSPGLDFETKIFYKPEADKLLEAELNKPNYQCSPIMLGANTDPYQPVEKKLNLTRKILEVLNSYNHPVVIVTKSSLIERDLDLLSDMAKKNIVKVAVSLTTLSNKLKLIMEPRSSGPKGRLRAIEKLSLNKIPIRVMTAPIIPMINDMELEKLLRAASEAGARYASYVLIRLPHEVKDLFREWLTVHFPDRAEHVMSIIRQMRGGKEYDASFGSRMRGEGVFATMLEKRFRLACRRFRLNDLPSLPLEINLFKKRSVFPTQLSFTL